MQRLEYCSRCGCIQPIEVLWKDRYHCEAYCTKCGRRWNGTTVKKQVWDNRIVFDKVWQNHYKPLMQGALADDVLRTLNNRITQGRVVLRKVLLNEWGYEVKQHPLGIMVITKMTKEEL